MSRKKLPAWNFNLRLYVGGPMTGLPNSNRAMFQHVLEQLRQQGYYAEGPVDIEHPDFEYEDDSYESKLKADFNVLHNCNGIVLLPGWTQSRGALAEFSYAATAGLFVFFWHEVPGINIGTLVRMDNWEADSGAATEQNTHSSGVWRETTWEERLQLFGPRED